MDSLKKLIAFAEEVAHPLYIEHNAYLNVGIELINEIDDLLEEGLISPLIGERLKEQESIWSITYFHINGDKEVCVDATLERAAYLLLVKLGMA